MGEHIDISVVIGFRNWGQRRLSLAIRSIQDSFGELIGEVIVSDYGSDDGQVTRSSIESTGAKYIYTATDGTWSRSRALNAGFAISRGQVLVSTDADMVFSPRSFEIIGKLILEDPSLCLLLQCRDLPASWSDAEVEAGFEWETFDAVARLRPRWGMGGMMAVPRDVFERIRGLDERMHTYGGEDIDFATRAKRAGQRLLWVEHSDVRMYHMWHPPTRKRVEVHPAARQAIEYNKGIVYNDKTFVRNTSQWDYRLPDAAPLVTVAIATRDRATLLRESLISVLGQTMTDFEIVVVDDGSTDETKEVVDSLGDPRIRYIFQEGAGVAAARNRAADESRGFYTAIHDDDDLMTPWRLQTQLDKMEVGIHGVFGSFVNFDDSTGAMQLYRSKALNAGTIDETGGAPGHGTWLVQTDILRRLRYDESLSSGVDNNLALRMVRSGFSFVHSGEIVMLRRMHPGQITVKDEHQQKLAARQTRQMFSFGTTAWGSNKLKEQRGPNDWVPIRYADELENLVAYLPDRLVHRHTADPQLVRNTERSGVRVWDNNQELGTLVNVRNISAENLAELTSSGRVVDIQATLRLPDSEPAADCHELAEEALIDLYLRRLARDLLTEAEDDSAVVALAARSQDVGSGPDGAYVVKSRRFEGSNGRMSYSLLLDETGKKWASWVAGGELDVVRVVSRAVLDLSMPESNEELLTQGGAR